MKILALDTTQAYCSVALSVGDQLIYREELAPRSHTDLILPQVKAVLAEADLSLNTLDALAFGCGPGSFTGLRIAAGVIQGLAFGVDLPVVPVSSLGAMAQGQYREILENHKSVDSLHVSAMFDARIGEVYWGNYSLLHGIMRPVTVDALDSPENIHLPDDRSWLAIGQGWSAYPQMRQRLSDQLIDVRPDTAPLARDIIPIAGLMIDNGQTVGADEAIPVYLRHKVAQTIEERAL